MVLLGIMKLTIEDIDNELSEPTDMRILVIEKAFAEGYSIDRIHDLTQIDKWFLVKLKNIYNLKIQPGPGQFP